MCGLTQGVIRRLGNTRVSLAWEEHQAPILTELCRKMARSGYEAGYRRECGVWGEQLKLTKPAMEEANQRLQYEILSKLVVGEMFDSGVEEMGGANGRGPVHLLARGADCCPKHGHGQAARQYSVQLPGKVLDSEAVCL